MRTRKRFGQHFLESAWVRKVIEAAAPQPGDVFLEIGPGPGALTNALAPRVGRLVAIEIDRDLADALKPTVPGNVEVITADVLDVDLQQVVPFVAGSPVRVAGNLPYNISSPILFRLFEAADQGRRLSDATLMLQREVADRLVARPGTKEYGILTLMAALHADVTLLFTLPPGAFRPPPKVTSAVVRVQFRPPTVPVPDQALLAAMVRAMFSQRRKTLGNALKPFADSRGVVASAVLTRAGVDATRRPETLDLPEVARLAEVFASGSRPDVL